MVAMVAYEFYRFDKLKGRDLIAILPERRKSPERITEESVMKWVKKFLDDREDLRDIFFIRVTFDGSEDEKRTEESETFLTNGRIHEDDSLHRQL